MACVRDDDGKVDPGMALALSGGGYRAAAFHVGALLRLNESGLLKRLKRVSSVSGGSIVAGTLGLRWKDLAFDRAGVARNMDAVVSPMREMLSTSIDVGAVIGGAITPTTAGELVASSYDRVLFKGATLQNLPDDEAGEGPRFVINATNVRSASLFRFSRSYMADYQVGAVCAPTVPLATAVAASSAFPPFLSPMPVKVTQPFEELEGAHLRDPVYRGTQSLTDGGVYDNLGLETIDRFMTMLVSDAGMKIKPDPRPDQTWTLHTIRVLNMIDNQVRSLRVRMLIDAYKRKERVGAYWSVRQPFDAKKVPSDPLGCARRDATSLAEVPTRLDAMNDDTQERLINWGYASCDAQLRIRFAPHAAALYGVAIREPKGFPYPRGY